jgi:PEP-CTERM/exosortase A-associated glycosyltransferase
MTALKSRIEQAIQEWQPDMLHAHSPSLVGLPALWAARKYKLPLVYEVRDLWENACVDRGKFTERSVFYRIAQAAETYLLRRADAVVTICEKLHEEVVRRTGRAENVYVVGNGVDLSNFDPKQESAALRNRLNLVGKRVIGYVGTFQPYEGLKLLIAALPEILKKEPNVHLVIAGSGGQEEELHGLVRTSGLKDRVTFTGRLPHSQVAEVYALAEMMVYPRLLTRVTALTTPLKPLEAMAMGKTVLVSDVPAMHELVKPGETGLMFRAGDASHLADQCLRALQEGTEQPQWGQRARDWVLEERQWSTLVKRYEKIYQKAASVK